MNPLNNKLTLVMLRLYTCCFLILMMVAMPVMAAFSHCIDKNLDAEQKTTKMSLTHLPLLKHSNKNMQFCHAMAHCNFHLCHNHYFISSNSFYSLIGTHLYSYSKNDLLSSFIYPPELRPPIS
jgi:hypothetical protein